ncbi:MAG: four helix bundle protein [Dehalococcoidia bacterium]
MKPYQDYEVFKRSHELNMAVYHLTDAFPKHEMFGLTSQMRRAASSVPMNIAEGSVKSEREFRQTLRTSLGSAAELEYQFLMARDLGYVAETQYETLTGQVISIKKMLSAFIKAIDRSLGATEDRRPTTNDEPEALG